MLNKPRQEIGFEMNEAMLHLLPTTTFGNIIQGTLRKIDGLSILLKNEEGTITVDPRLNTNIVSEASALCGRVKLVMTAPEQTDPSEFQNVFQVLQREINDFTSHPWEDENSSLRLQRFLKNL